MSKNLGPLGKSFSTRLKREIDFTNFLKNKENIIGKDFYYGVGFDVIDYIVFTPIQFFYSHNHKIQIDCKGLKIKPDGMNVPWDGMNFILYELFCLMDEGVIKILTPENYAKILLTYGA